MKYANLVCAELRSRYTEKRQIYMGPKLEYSYIIRVRQSSITNSTAFLVNTSSPTSTGGHDRVLIFNRKQPETSMRTSNSITSRFVIIRPSTHGQSVDCFCVRTAPCLRRVTSGKIPLGQQTSPGRHDGSVAVVDTAALLCVIYHCFELSRNYHVVIAPNSRVPGNDSVRFN